MAPRWTLCKCGARYERIKRKCPSCGKTRAKKRVPKHAQTLRDHSYEHYMEVSKAIHGVTDESCCVCRKPRSPERRHDRDHDHTTGNPRGLACHLCNRDMPRWMTAHRAKLMYEYLTRVDQYYLTKPKEDECQDETPSPPN